MKDIGLRFGKAGMVVLCACLLSAVALAQEEPKTKDPNSAEENSVPEVRSKTRVRFGGLSLGGFYQHDRGYYYPPYYPYWYSPAWSGVAPYAWWPQPDFSPMPYHFGYYRGFSRIDGMGEVKLLTAEKSADVFLDGAYAGRSEDLRSIWLDPGAYTLELKMRGKQPFKKRIYVLSGKSVKVDIAWIDDERGEATQ